MRTITVGMRCQNLKYLHFAAQTALSALKVSKWPTLWAGAGKCYLIWLRDE
jgi:hypothetical protein